MTIRHLIEKRKGHGSVPFLPFTGMLPELTN